MKKFNLSCIPSLDSDPNITKVEISVLKTYLKLNGKEDISDLFAELGGTRREALNRARCLRRKLFRRGITIPSVESKPQPTNSNSSKYTVRDIDLLTKEINFEATGKAPSTLEELLALCNVDTKVWRVKSHTLNTWTTTAMVSGEFKQAVNIQVKALLERISVQHSELLLPDPVKINISRKSSTRKNTTDEVEKTIVASDLHIGFREEVVNGSTVLVPFHDRAAIAILLDSINLHKPKLVILSGDILDLPDWSTKYPRNPNVANLTQDAIIEAGWVIGKIVSLLDDDARLVIMSGNHDDRLNKMATVCMEQALNLKSYSDVLSGGPDILSLRKLLSLDEIGVECIDKYPSEINLPNNWSVVHGHIAASRGKTGLKYLDTSDKNHIYGHIHRYEVVTKQIGSKTIKAVCPGCLCKIDGTVPGQGPTAGWDQGFAILTHYFTERDGLKTNTDFQVVSINDGTALIGNCRVSSPSVSDYIDCLIEDTGWERFTYDGK